MTAESVSASLIAYLIDIACFWLSVDDLAHTFAHIPDRLLTGSHEAQLEELDAHAAQLQPWAACWPRQRLVEQVLGASQSEGYWHLWIVDGSGDEASGIWRSILRDFEGSLEFGWAWRGGPLAWFPRRFEVSE